jgi:predicted NBD/HSP70 family sugar kinase
MATSSHLRRINQRKIVQSLLRLHSSASRTKLAEIAGMSQATVGRIVDDLMAQSILAEVNGTGLPATTNPRQLGRPSRLLELDKSRRRFLLVQLGVEETRLSTMPVAIPETDQWAAKFDTPDSSSEWFEKLTRACRKLPLRGIDAFIMSCPGVIDESMGKVLLCPNIHWAEHADFPEGFRSIARMPAVFLQEIRALALGQLAIEPDMRDFFLVDFGDGVGGASIIAGKLQTGHLPLSGELGHTPVLGNDRRCGCGSVGCVETLVSRKGLLKSFYEDTGQRSWEALVSHIETKGMPDWLKVSLDAVADTIAGALNVLGISSVVLTGLLSDLPTPVSEYLCTGIRGLSMWSHLGNVEAKVSPRHRMAGMICAGIDRVLFSIGA